MDQKQTMASHPTLSLTYTTERGFKISEIYNKKKFSEWSSNYLSNTSPPPLSWSTGFLCQTRTNEYRFPNLPQKKTLETQTQGYFSIKESINQDKFEVYLKLIRQIYIHIFLTIRGPRIQFGCTEPPLSI